MSVSRGSLYGTSSIGVYGVATDKFAIIPADIPEKFEREVEADLKVDIIKGAVLESFLLGVFIAANSYGVILPRLVRDEELNVFRKTIDAEIMVLDVKETALGNLILANDKAALVSPLIPRKALKRIEDALGVEVMQRNLAGSNLVGAIAVVTNKGLLACPLASDEELDELEDFFKVKADIGTINRGNIFVRSGMLANSYGAIVGSETTGPELMRIQQTLYT